MFRIPSFYEMDLEWNEAVRIIKGRANGDLLEGMKSMDQLWSDYCKGPAEDSGYEDDDDFYYTWSYEMNAYNVVFEGMSKLFAPVEAA